MGIIYLVRNQVNGKCYLGKTVGSLKSRRTLHHSDAKRGSKTAFHCALRKYGLEAFTWIVLHDDIADDELNKLEILSIRSWNTKAPNGYNLTDGGEGASGYKPSDETRRKRGAALKGNQHAKGLKHTDEAKRKMSEAHKGRKPSEEHRRKLSVARKGKKFRPLSEETRRKLSAANKGKKLSAEHRRKLSEACKGNQNFKGKKHTVERRRKMSEAAKGNQHARGQKHSAETRRKMIETRKRNLSKARAK